MSLTPLIPPYVPSAPGSIALLLPAPPKSFLISVATSGEGSDSIYNGLYYYAGQSWAGDVWALEGPSVVVDGSGAIIGAGPAFVANLNGGTPIWRLGSSSDWGTVSPDEYLYQEPTAVVDHPGLVSVWIDPNDYEFTVNITAVPIELPAITRAVEPYNGATAPSSLTKLI